MLARLILFIILGIVVARAFWRFVDGIAAGVSARPRGAGGVTSQGVAMVRDPVCGTFILPDRARMITAGGAQIFFCSDACRERYRRSTGAGRADRVEGRIA